ncbi:MAG: sensor histidine kinase [Opitutae bacterium]|nr:sensor histidine kinase [Opitutae bacterium]
MSPPALECHRNRTGSLYGAFAFASIVLTCFVGYLYSGRFYQPAAMVPLSFALGALYVALGILSSDWLKSGRPRAFAAYFLGQCAVLTALVFLSPLRGFFGIIVLPVVSQAIFDLGKRGAFAVSLYLFLVSVSVWVTDFGWTQVVEVSLNYTPAFAFTIAFTLITKQALNAREQAEKLHQELEAANQRLREHAAQAEDLATTRERNRVAREIHDGVGHYLTVVKTQLDAATALLPTQPEQARAAVANAASLTGEALHDVRRPVGALRADTARLPLPAALQALAHTSGLPVAVRVEGEARPLPPAVEHALFRAAQEGLTNIRKHAHATAANVRLDFRAPQLLTLVVTDNGCGAPAAPASPAAGFGLRGLRERIALLGGAVETGNRPEGGFLLRVEVPA